MFGFVDFAKAFDYVSRNSLLYKLTKTKIGGNFYKLIKSMYSCTKFGFKTDDKLGLKEPLTGALNKAMD